MVIPCPRFSRCMMKLEYELPDLVLVEGGLFTNCQKQLTHAMLTKKYASQAWLVSPHGDFRDLHWKVNKNPSHHAACANAIDHAADQRNSTQSKRQKWGDRSLHMWQHGKRTCGRKAEGRRKRSSGQLLGFFLLGAVEDDQLFHGFVLSFEVPSLSPGKQQVNHIDPVYCGNQTIKKG